MAQEHDYRVIPAPTRGEKAKGVKGTAEQFAHALSQTMNRMAAEGWEYLRAEALPCEERDGWFGRKTTERHMLVFRRPIAASGTGPAAGVAPGTSTASVSASVAGAARPGTMATLTAGAARGEEPAQPTAIPAAPPIAAPHAADEGPGAEPARSAGALQALEWARRRSAEPPLVAPRLTRPAPGGPRPRDTREEP